MIFKEYMDRVIGIHEHVDRDWVERTVSDALGETDFQQLCEADTTAKALSFGIMIGVRQTIKADGDIVKIYKDKEEIASRTFMRPEPEEAS